MTDDALHQIRVCFLGRFSLDIGGRPVTRWRGGRARGLFQYLLVNRNKVVLKERLYEVLWPGAEWSPGSSSLKVAVHALRQVLDVQSGEPEITARYQDYGYVLTVGPGVWIDYLEFETLAAKGAAAEAARDLATAAEHYRRAIALYRGDFLIGESADWVDEQREWLRGTALRALEFLTGHARRAGDEDLLLEYCRLSLEIEACHEESYRTIMRIHAGRGELGQVQRWYSLCVDRLRTHLGVAPSPETDRVLREALDGPVRPGPVLSRPA